ncbi:A24 family peptidase [Paenibacillus eucommiae]|uniref:A24 family peptidase n=1 Tax=Paenibacillus eucommiae TaxID=1355755 RepID=UPI0028A6132B|nr:A24 family peptidase [Paenibacillus eucommiae]
MLLLFIFILLAFISDVKRSLIPNVLTGSAAAAGVVYHSVFDRWDGFLYSMIGLIAGFLLLLILYLFRAIGAGDVKLFAAVGAMMGAGFVWQSMMYSLVYAGLIGFLLLIFRKKVSETVGKMAGWLFSIIALKSFSMIKNAKEQELMQFPFMYAVAPGIMTAWYYSLL